MDEKDELAGRGSEEISEEELDAAVGGTGAVEDAQAGVEDTAEALGLPNPPRTG